MVSGGDGTVDTQRILHHQSNRNEWSISMGFRVSWIARSGTSTRELLELSGRTVSTERHEFPDVGWYLLELPAWVVLIADGTENYSGLNGGHAQALSKGNCETIFFWCSDTVMATDLACFRDGAEVWSIQYDCGDQLKRPAMNGDVPKIAHEILADLRMKQVADDGADYVYDLTAELGRRLVGFRHDTDLEGYDPEPFQVLVKPDSGRRNWWQFWKQ